jgi:tRNA pseudouridine55 synthase
MSWRESLVNADACGPEGVLLIDKPAGPTSHDVVSAVRRALPKGTKVGHAGTLDPFATGLLIVLFGRATRVQRLLLGQPKCYEVEARLGWTSTTGDRDGVLVETGNVPTEPLALPTGMIDQRPPAYSAVKVGGRRAYKLARAGEDVELPVRQVEVTQFDQLWREDDRAAFRIACSSGTYVRSLIADLGDAYCTELRRTSIGPFSLEEAGPEPHPLADVIGRLLPVVRLEEPLARRLGHGQHPPVPAAAAAESGELMCVDQSGSPVALATVADGVLVPSVGFRS